MAPMSGYKKFSSLVQKMLIVNDPAEHGVKLIQEFVNTTQDADIRQWRMLSASDQRKMYSNNATKKDEADTCCGRFMCCDSTNMDTVLLFSMNIDHFKSHYFSYLLFLFWSIGEVKIFSSLIKPVAHLVFKISQF